MPKRRPNNPWFGSWETMPSYREKAWRAERMQPTEQEIIQGYSEAPSPEPGTCRYCGEHISNGYGLRAHEQKCGRVDRTFSEYELQELL